MKESAEVRRCDVAIVGGGIAGISIAERISREARRQGKKARILLVEANDSLGGGASGGAEGLFHTGSLYSTLDNTSVLLNFINSFEDLYNWYYWDPLFASAVPHCNLHQVAPGNAPQYDFGRLRGYSWFVEQVPYLLPKRLASLQRGSEARTEVSDWQRRTGRAMTYIKNAYFECDWLDRDFGCCQVPHDWQKSDRTRQPRDRQDQRVCTRTANDSVRGTMSHHLDDVIRRLRHVEGNDFHVMASRDAVMNTWLIMSDLASAAAKWGVDVVTNCKLEPAGIQISEYGLPDTVSGLLFRQGDEDKLLHVIASQYVFTLGAGFDELTFLRDRLDIRVKVQKTASVMLVAVPALFDHSFVRLDQDSKNTFNHIYRPSPMSQMGETYSVIADANAVAGEALQNDCARAAVQLLKNAQGYFGSRTEEVRIRWYSCTKTEFPDNDNNDRRYSYWWGPAHRQWATPSWREARQLGSHLPVDDLIRRIVRCGNPLTACESLGDISNSSWALKTALHFALLHLIQAGQSGDSELMAKRGFNAFQTRIGECFANGDNIGSEHLRTVGLGGEGSRREPKEPNNRGAAPNFICAIPGKFSLFPSLAHNVYLELEARQFFRQLPEGMSREVGPAKVAISKADYLTLDQVHHSGGALS